jgi:hypothetical protein
VHLDGVHERAHQQKAVTAGAAGFRAPGPVIAHRERHLVVDHLGRDLDLWRARILSVLDGIDERLGDRGHDLECLLPRDTGFLEPRPKPSAQGIGAIGVRRDSELERGGFQGSHGRR